jgi:ABC-type transporter Mla maintaining outer membrane lipid asymmetry permease subunit MlaE
MTIAVVVSSLLRRLDEVVVGSLLLVLVSVAGIGAAMADQAGRQALRLLGDQSFIGREYPVLGVQEFCPLVVALVLSLRVGAGFTAEIATLRRDATFDVWRVAGVSPWRARVLPMIVSLPLGTLALTLCGCLAWELAGVVVMWARSGVNPFTFVHLEVISAPLVGLLVGKSLIFGGCVALGAVAAAMSPAAPGELGATVTRGVVWGTVLTLGANLLFDIGWYVA